jgi:regulator of replication initiation timing
MRERAITQGDNQMRPAAMTRLFDAALEIQWQWHHECEDLRANLDFAHQESSRLRKECDALRARLAQLAALLADHREHGAPLPGYAELIELVKVSVVNEAVSRELR